MDEISLTTLPETIEVSTPVTSMPVKVQQVLALMACGFSIASIAKLSKVTPSAISNLVERWDPNRQFTLTNKEKRMFLAKLWQARAGEALLRMTSEKLEDCSAMELAQIAKIGVTESDKVFDDSKPEEKDPYQILRQLEVPRRANVLPCLEPLHLLNGSTEA